MELYIRDISSLASNSDAKDCVSEVNESVSTLVEAFKG